MWLHSSLFFVFFLVSGGIFLSFVLGLVVGSFLNVVIFRIHSGNRKWWQGRSRCPKCERILTVRDLVPVVSFLLTHGRCRSCGQKIDIQYPLVEFLTGLLFSIFFISHFGWTGAVPLSGRQLTEWNFLLRDWLVVSVAVLIFVYDLRYMLILDKVMLPAIVIFFVWNSILGAPFFDMLLGGCIGFFFFALQFWLSRGRWVGGGDVRLGLFIGVVMGWQLTLLALFLAYIVGALFAVGLIISGRKKWGERIPFGTFLTVSLLVSLLFGETIMAWYLGYFI